jgi:hypothetical protein
LNKLILALNIELNDWAKEALCGRIKTQHKLQAAQLAHP